MKHARISPLLAGIVFAASAFGQSQPTIAAALDREIGDVEKLNVPRAGYKGVRTFALEVRHVAASNYAPWSPLTGDSSRKTSWVGTVLRV
jgi:hypothetical protein